MGGQHVRLRDVLHERHWQSHGTFCREYDRAAKAIDPRLAGSWPSRAQFHRWLTGDVKGLPYPDHRLVLQRMLPEWTVYQLFELCGPVCPTELAAQEPQQFADVVARSIAEGLWAQGTAVKDWGIGGVTRTPVRAVRPPPVAGAPADSADGPLPESIAHKLLALGQVQRIPPNELTQLASLAGNLVDLSVSIDLTIAEDGGCEVTYRYHVLNLTDAPVTRLSRDLWFQHSRGRLDLVALPGDAVGFGYACSGGEFRKDYYWRQQILRYTRQFTLSVRHQGTRGLAGFTAIEELPDGTENHSQSVAWSYDNGDIVMIFTLDHLRPSQYATLRWEAV